MPFAITPSTGGTDIGRALSLPQQALGLRSRFPSSQITLRSRRLHFVGDLTPSPLSETYTISVAYDGFHTPEVTVLKPELIHPPAEELPHVFDGDVLCLHLPSEWSPAMLLTLTTIPWTAEWLLHYELWLATDGTWCGGGHHATR